MRPMSLTQRDLEGETIVVGPTEAVPIMREHALRWPGGALLWRRPLALRVTAEGRTYHVPILNITLRAICAALAIGALFALLIGVLTNLERSR